MRQKRISYKTKQTENRNLIFCIPVLRTLLTAGGVELIESPDRLCSISVVPGGDKDGGLTEDSWTFQKIERKKEITQVYLKYTYWLSLVLLTFLIMYKLSKVFTWHFGFQILLRNFERHQGCYSVDISPSCHFWSLNTWHLARHTHCFSHFDTRRFFLLLPSQNDYTQPLKHNFFPLL